MRRPRAKVETGRAPVAPVMPWGRFRRFPLRLPGATLAPMTTLPLFTAIVRFQLRPGIDRAQALDEIRHTIPLYQAQPALIRKQISLDLEQGRGMSIYLWRDRAAAERFYDMARPKLREQTGAEPEIEIHETQVLVDNVSGEVVIA